METINIDLTPGGVLPRVHLNQYDNGLPFAFMIYWNGDDFDGEGFTITITVRKPDGTLYTANTTSSEAPYVFEASTQLTTVAGESVAELKIVQGDIVIHSANFLICVEESPEQGGLPSESDITNLRTQIASLVSEEVAEQYTGSVIFDSAPTSGHNSGYAVTSAGLKSWVKAANVPCSISGETGSNVSAVLTAVASRSRDNEDSIDDVNIAVSGVQSNLDDLESELFYTHGQHTVGECVGNGIVWGSNNFEFYIPLPKRIKSGDSLTFTGGSFQIYTSDDYTQTMGIPVLTGATFTPHGDGVLITIIGSSISVPITRGCVTIWWSSGTQIRVS